ncbi:Rieske 2Fe-2S domain-containing protein [Egicoccus halophilus]|uniref:Ring-hydroxylating oxygenase subunit alpha n=1 Tax=Egicoccus halophilus TaxID=1670830 RepID=A0A8J3ES93_9ACTN|nr:Rieske 2Fe-2S domain-containing protein [Egicoccus halophilus]GGI02430.1 ring-hydroxylating oxygenase subunit alpha [Egicoccus halophilus]
MLKAEQNEAITRVGPGTPMGEVMRRYWQPALLAQEVAEPDSPPVRVQLLGESLVAFRDSRGEVGLIDSKCPHRRAPMFFGRNEEAGLRCVYHGWKFDTAGNCVDLPSEPPDSPLKAKINMTAYPTHEAAGVVWAYLGPRAEMPEAPDYEWMRAFKGGGGVSRTNERANWLQALEGGIDTTHSSFAHNNDLSTTSLLRQQDTHPKLEVEVTDYGFRYASIRRISENRRYIRVYQFVMPFQQIRPATVAWDGQPNDMPTMHGHLWAPMDDYTTAVYNFMAPTDLDIPLSREDFERSESRAGRGPEHFIGETYWLQRNASNDYLIDREVQRTQTYTGIEGINTQDFALQEGMDPICDRSREHLGTSDRAIIAARRLLLDAIEDVQAGRPLRGTDRQITSQIRPAEAILTEEDGDWRDYFKGELVARW